MKTSRPREGVSERYDAERDEYTCQAGKKLRAKYEIQRKSKSGFASTITHYECDNCSGCEYKKSCTKAKENRTGKQLFEKLPA